MASAAEPLPRAISPVLVHTETAAEDEGLSAFISVRPRLFGIAYRMLGSAAEAEDIVQDVWLRWQSTNRSVIVNPAAYLATTTTRLCINAATCARVRREMYVGPWLPEPVDTSDDPRLGAERDEALKLAVLVLLEKLSPTERAAYVLREAFDYPYSEIAEILRTAEANTRQLVSRARRHVAEGRRTTVSSAEQGRLLDAFLDAARRGDMAALEDLFAEDVISYSDGGGMVRAARFPLFGRERIARFIAAVATHFYNGVTFSRIEINGQAAGLILREGKVVAVATIDVSERGIHQIMWLMRPSKLAALSKSVQRAGYWYLPRLVAS